MSNRTHSPKRDLHAEITANLIKAIEANPGKPKMPWRRSGRRSGRPLWIPENASSNAAYNGINTVNLWVAAELRGFTSPVWATYRQWSELGAQVVKGAKSELVVFYREYEAAADSGSADDDGKDTSVRRVAKASRVFNIAEVEGFDDPGKPEPLGPIERIAKADGFITACSANIRHGGERAFYAPSSDHIQMPDEGLFVGTDTMTRDEGYYAVLLHELTHWTAHKSRCDRDLSGRFGRQAYAAEELVAEIGAAMLCAETGVTQDTRPDHAQYLANWLSLLKNDPKAIFTAAAKASQAVMWLKAKQGAA